ncbi:MAG: MarR family winged helix-turn-helix transcriptional regulator, partial [Microthrixaceae bacterium]
AAADAAAAFEREFPGGSLLASSAMRELEVVGAMLEGAIGAVTRRHGLSHAALNALAVIEGAGGPLPAGEVAARMHITSGTTTSVLDTLERKGWITRASDPEDRRRVMVDITPDAQDLLDRVLPEVAQLCATVMSPLGDAGVRSLLASLGTLRGVVEGLPDDLPPAPKRRTPAHLRRR